MDFDHFSIRQGHLGVRPLIPSDVAWLTRWLNDPKVLAYYEGRDHPQSPELIRQRFLTKSGEPILGCLVTWRQDPAGYAQIYPLDDQAAYHFQEPQDGAWGMDLFIGETRLWGCGIGTQLVSALSEALFQQMGADRILIDPQVNNPRAVHVYQKCGFRIKRRLVRHELHEGRWEDCWLMEKTAPRADAPSRSASHRSPDADRG